MTRTPGPADKPAPSPQVSYPSRGGIGARCAIRRPRSLAPLADSLPLTSLLIPHFTYCDCHVPGIPSPRTRVAMEGAANPQRQHGAAIAADTRPCVDGKQAPSAT